MFFLKALPSRAMVDRYVGETGTGEPNVILQALTMMHSASQLIRDIEKHFAAHGLSQLKFLVLVVIDREDSDEGLRHADVAARMDVSKPVLSRSVRALVKSGLLTEVADGEDARSRRLTVTTDGKEVLARVLPDYFDIIQRHMTGEAGKSDRPLGIIREDER